MKKIVIDLTDLYDHLSGIERYAMELTRHMLPMRGEMELVLLFKEEVPAAFGGVVGKKGIEARVLPKAPKLFFRQILLPLQLYQIKADAFLFLAFPEPWLFFHTNIITALHDMSYFDCGETMKWSSKWYFRISALHTMVHAAHILTISKFSARRICYYAKKIPGISEKSVRKRLSILRCGVEESLYAPLKKEASAARLQDAREEGASEEPLLGEEKQIGLGEDVQPQETRQKELRVELQEEKIRDRYGLPKQYILTLSTLEPRKNLKLLVDAYEKLRRQGSSLPKLVLAGRVGWKMEEFLSQYDLKDEIILPGFIQEEDLPVLYAGAEFFVFPSKYEGFGMPPLEAMACGCLVLSSDATAMPEVLGNAAIYFKNMDQADLMRQLSYVHSLSAEEKADFLQAGKVRSKKYRWSDAAAHCIRLINKELDAKAPIQRQR